MENQKANQLATAITKESILSLRLSNQDMNIKVSEKLISVQVRKPGPQEFFRVHPSPDFRMEAAIIPDRVDGRFFIVKPNIYPALTEEATLHTIFTAINTHNLPFIWAIKRQDQTGNIDNWNRSALEVANVAQNNWCRLLSDRQRGAYRCFEAVSTLDAPRWPDSSFEELLNKAFPPEQIISDLDHPFLKQLRGEKQ